MEEIERLRRSKTEKVVITQTKGKNQKGYITERTDTVKSPEEKGLKTYKEAISFGRKQKYDMAYSDKALSQLSAIKIMDYLTGRKERGKEDLLYYTEVTNVEGEEMVNIDRIISVNNSRAFSTEPPMDPVEFGLIDEKGEFVIPYDRVLADRIINTVVFASGRNDLTAVDGLGQSAGEKLMRGFAGSHAFTVMDIVNIGDEEYIALRNPWGWTTATHEVNELTGGTSVNMNRFEATSFLVTPEEYLTYFKGYRSVKLNAEKTGKK